MEGVEDMEAEMRRRNVKRAVGISISFSRVRR
jgi:hypothetical protein